MAISSRREQMGSSLLQQTAATIGNQQNSGSVFTWINGISFGEGGKGVLNQRQALSSSLMTKDRAGEH
jgi:hypothetical protein